jgi:hypothetical protein
VDVLPEVLQTATYAAGGARIGATPPL